MVISCKISNQSLQQLNIINQHKLRVLKDIHEKYLSNKISFEDLKQIYFPQKKQSLKIRRQYTKRITNEDRCCAYIWSKDGPIQCKNSKKLGNYCKRHYYKRYYGDINNNNNDKSNSLEDTN